MGEYAIYNGQEIKIGTCESMYYLRADQARSVKPLRGNVDPFKQAKLIRFRFPFPDEDKIQPGQFDSYNRKLAVHGIEAPEEIDHYSIQFRADAGLLVSLPCPESKEGKASGIRVGYNGYGGKVGIVQQRMIDGQLVLVCECGSCGAAYRCPTMDDAQPVIDALLKEADSDDHQQWVSDRMPQGGPKQSSRGNFKREVAKRIVAGYTGPNLWNQRVELAATL